jgi:hypothetical protein
LSARTGGAYETDLDVVLVDREVAGNPQHGVTGGRIFPQRESGQRKIAGFVVLKDGGNALSESKLRIEPFRRCCGMSFQILTFA